MGLIDQLFRATSTPTTLSKEPKYVEVEWKGHEHVQKEHVRVLTMSDYSDVEGVLELLRDRSNIVVLRIKPRLVQEKMELKRALKRIQRTCQAIGGDIAGVKEDVIIITPPNIEIMRTSSEVPAAAGTSTVTEVPEFAKE